MSQVARFKDGADSTFCKSSDPRYIYLNLASGVEVTTPKQSSWSALEILANGSTRHTTLRLEGRQPHRHLRPSKSDDGILATISKELNGNVYGVENGRSFLFLYVLLYDPVISRYTYLLTYVGVRLIRIFFFLIRGKSPA